MCIRDSTYLGGAPVTERIGKEAIQAIDSAARTVLKLAIACLLYTSDAADERSSVDLGGRRIHKKKTKNKQKKRQKKRKRHNVTCMMQQHTLKNQKIKKRDI